MQEGKIHVQTDAVRTSSESMFQLKRSDTSSTNISIEVNFSPVTSNPNNGQNCQLNVQRDVDEMKSFPVFNMDRKFYTPCFILQMDKSKYVQNGQIYFAVHERKKAQLEEQKDEIFVPKPSKNCCFCCICKQGFEDYLTHLTHPKHQFLLKKSQFTNEIKDLCFKFGAGLQVDKKQTVQKKLKQKKIKKIQKCSSQKTKRAVKTRQCKIA